MYTLVREQHLPVSPAEAWRFISRPENLNRITPKDLGFQILSELPEEMYPGLIIQYRIKLPILGWQRWVTEIKHVQNGIRFVDEQRFGPYRFWYHLHELEEQNGEVLMRDRVHYTLPFGFLGRIAHALFVRRMLEQIFSFREAALKEMFGN